MNPQNATNGKGGRGQNQKNMPLWLQVVVALIAVLAMLWWGITYLFPDDPPVYETSHNLLSDPPAPPSKL